MVSNYSRFYPLAAYLARNCRRRIGIAMGIPTLVEIFNEKYYTDLEGGILESFGRLFKNAVKLYIHPLRETSGELITASTLRVAPHLQNLYAHLLENNHLAFIKGFDENLLKIHSQDVLAMIQAGQPDWESQVPTPVVKLIKERGYFGFKGQ